MRFDDDHLGEIPVDEYMQICDEAYAGLKRVGSLLWNAVKDEHDESTANSVMLNSALSLSTLFALALAVRSRKRDGKETSACQEKVIAEQIRKHLDDALCGAYAILGIKASFLHVDIPARPKEDDDGARA